MVTHRRGSATRGVTLLGCLLSLLVMIVVVYYGINLGKIWWRYWEIQDRMKTAARFAAGQTPEQIAAQLEVEAAEVGVPPPGRRFSVTRIDNPPSLRISTAYQERIDLPLLHRTFAFRPVIIQRYTQ